MPAPKAVLLDVGGIFHLPDHERMRAAFARAEFAVDVDVLDRAHYAGAAQFTVDNASSNHGTEIDWKSRWQNYLDAYITEAGVPERGPTRDEVHVHVDSEFAVGDLWARIIPGSVDGLRALVATGVRVGIISNADGTVAQRLAAQEVLQVGPGLGVEVECVIDSGAVGVSKPDPRIFQIALDALGIAAEDAWYVGDMPGIDVVGARAAGLWPIVMDPFDLQAGVDYRRVSALTEVAELISAS